MDLSNTNKSFSTVSINSILKGEKVGKQFGALFQNFRFFKQNDAKNKAIAEKI